MKIVDDKSLWLQLAEEFNLSPREAKELDEQYWYEYVVRHLAYPDFDALEIYNLGVFTFKLKKLELLRKRAKAKQESYSLLNAKIYMQKEIDRINTLIQYAEISNTKKKFQRYHG